MKKFILSILAVAAIVPLSAQNNRSRQMSPEEQAKQQKEMAERMKKETEEYFANADSADYGVRYRFIYKYDKERNLTFEEDRVVLVSPKVTLDMSYEGIGERRWRMANPGKQGGDNTLAYHLTPSFYFYYPETGRSVKTYRILGDELLLSDNLQKNNWNVTDERKKIGDYDCRKATITKDGRTYTAWFTTDLPGVAAPRNLSGLPGVVIEAADETGEVKWNFNQIVNSIPGDKLYIKFPDNFLEVNSADIPKIIRLCAHSDSYFEQAGLTNRHPGSYPEKYRPSTGIDACLVTNPIEK